MKKEEKKAEKEKLQRPVSRNLGAAVVGERGRDPNNLPSFDANDVAHQKKPKRGIFGMAGVHNFLLGCGVNLAYKCSLMSNIG